MTMRLVLGLLPLSNEKDAKDVPAPATASSVDGTTAQTTTSYVGTPVSAQLI